MEDLLNEIDEKLTNKDEFEDEYEYYYRVLQF